MKVHSIFALTSIIFKTHNLFPMEESRLKPMPVNYDQAMFNSIYKQTSSLRKKLAFGIDARRFGVDYQEILSWFDVKFLYAFTKYHDEFCEEVLKGHIIKALQFFRCRILRSAYTIPNSQIVQDIDELEVEDLFIEDPYDSSKQDLFATCMQFMKGHLSSNAYELLQVQLNPPPYVRSRVEEEGKNINKIPNSIYAEYFELGTDKKSLEYIKILKSEIEIATHKARQHFQSN